MNGASGDGDEQPFQIKELTHIKLLIPADIYQNLYPPIKLNDGLRHVRICLRSMEGCKCEHDAGEIEVV